MSIKRIQREMIDIKKEDLGSITLNPTDNIFIWKGSIPGPAGSPYEGGVFHVDVVLANDYPCVLVLHIVVDRVFTSAM
jgi:ubiquitin-protein ligase